VTENASIAWNWPPLFAVPGQTLHVEIISTTDHQPDSVTVRSGRHLDETIVTYDPGLRRWTAEIEVPDDSLGTAFGITATETTGNVDHPPIELTVPLVFNTDVIDPTIIVAQPVQVAELTYGAAPNQIGLGVPEVDGELQTPQSLRIDPVTDNFVLLDSVNHRLMILTRHGQLDKTIALSGDGTLEDVVVLGTSGRVVVSEWYAANGSRETSAHLVDLETGTDAVDGPLVLPQPAVPSNTELLWNQADNAVFGIVHSADTNLYRYYDTKDEILDVSTTPEHWWQSLVGADQQTVGLRHNEVEIQSRLPFGFASIINMTVDTAGIAVWVAGAVEEGSTDASGVHYYLGRTDPACHTTTMTEIGLSSTSELATQILVTRGQFIYIANVGLDSYRLERYDLGGPTCG
jgi:hypothetical protein